MKKKEVWVFNHYATTLDEGYGGRSYYQAKELASRGYQVVLIMAKNHHLKFRNSKSKLQSSEDLEFEVVKLPTLPYRSGSQFIRVCNWFIFILDAFLWTLIRGSKPNIAIISIPTNITGLLVYYFECFLGVRVILDVRDVWPLTLKNLKNRIHHRFIYWMLAVFEKLSYSRASVVISPLPGLQKRLNELKFDKKFFILPTGIDVDQSQVKAFGSNKSREPTGDVRVCYMGSIGLTNALACFFDLADAFQASQENVKFYLIGEGHKKVDYQLECRKRSLRNVIFEAAVSKRDVVRRLSDFDVLFLSWHPHDTYQYGIGPNKLGEYLASGVPILHVYSGAHDPITKYDCGITVPPDNDKMLIDALHKIIDADEQLKTRWQRNAEQAVKNVYLNRRIGEELDIIISEIIK